MIITIEGSIEIYLQYTIVEDKKISLQQSLKEVSTVCVSTFFVKYCHPVRGKWDIYIPLHKNLSNPNKKILLKFIADAMKGFCLKTESNRGEDSRHLDPRKQFIKNSSSDKALRLAALIF